MHEHNMTTANTDNYTATLSRKDSESLNEDLAIEIIKENPDSVIYAGLMEDWNNTSGLIFANGECHNGYVYGASCWATPIVDVDGKEIECWTYEETKEGSGKPEWLLNGDIHHTSDFYNIENLLNLQKGEIGLKE